MPTFPYGPAGGGWTPIVGDWDGDGMDTIGLYNPTTSMFYLRNSNTQGYADVDVRLRPGEQRLDAHRRRLEWRRHGHHRPVRPHRFPSFYLRNTQRPADWPTPTFNYGPANSGWTPIVGDWTDRPGGCWRPESAPAGLSALTRR